MMNSQKPAVLNTWESFFKLHGMLIPAMGLLYALIVWRWPDHLTVHPSFVRSVWLALVITLGSFLIAVIQRIIIGSNAGTATPYIFTMHLRPQFPTAPILELLSQMMIALVLVGLLQIVFALSLRNSIAKPKQNPLPSLADADLDSRTV